MNIKYTKDKLFCKTTNLHIHSNYSDGIFSVKELVKKCKKAGLTFVALTDHDNIDGQKEFLSFANKTGLNAFSGVELEGMYKKMQIHILGYDFDFKNKKIVDLCNKYKNFRKKYGENTLTKINKQLKLENKKFDLNAKELKKLYGNITMSVDIVNYLVLKKVAKNSDEGWQKYVLPNRVKLEVSAIEILNVIKKCGGFSILAHPGHNSLSFTKYGISIKGQEKLIGELKKFGLNGIEVYGTKHTKKQVKDYLGITNKLGLLVTRGTDFHSNEKGHNVLISE